MNLESGDEGKMETDAWCLSASFKTLRGPLLRMKQVATTDFWEFSKSEFAIFWLHFSFTWHFWS